MTTDERQLDLPMSETTETTGATGKHPVDPAEAYNPSTRLAKKRDFTLKRPGNVNYAAPGGSYPGSRVVVFTKEGPQGLEMDDFAKFKKQALEELGEGFATNAATLVNLYFKHRANLLTVAVIPSCDSEGNVALTVMFTNHLEGERLEYFQKYQEVMAQTMQKWEEERAAKAEEQAKRDEEIRKENDALLTLGRKARDHNLLEKLRELDEENKKLRRQLRKEDA